MLWFVLLLPTLGVQENTFTTELEWSSPPRPHGSDAAATPIPVVATNNKTSFTPNFRYQNVPGNGDMVDHSREVKIPKCCPLDSIFATDDCKTRDSVPFKAEFKVYEHNATHFRNESLDLGTIKFEPYHSAFRCSSGRYYLDQNEEEFAILVNGSLLVKSYISGILSGDHFCLENIQGTPSMQVFVCAPNEPTISTTIYNIYVTLTIVSTFCFAVTFYVYYFQLQIKDINRKCFTGYVFAMTVTFLSLTIVKTANVDSMGCQIIGFLLQLSVIVSFTMLAILCFDIYVIAKYIDDNIRRKRRFWYFGVTLGVPVLSVLGSLSRGLVPDIPNTFFKPQYGRNYCTFSDQGTTFFYVPAGVSIFVSVVCLVLTKLKIIQNDLHCHNDFFWLEKRTLYRLMWRKHLIIVLISFVWFLETSTRFYFKPGSNMAMAVDLVEASVGILVLLLFVVNKQTRTQIIENVKKRKKRNNVNEEEFLMN